MRATHVIISVVSLLLPALYYSFTMDEIALLAIPLFSVAARRYMGDALGRSLIGLFLATFSLASLLLYMDDPLFRTSGVLSYMFLVSIVLTMVIKHYGEKDER
jgi:hypothetical protein